MRYLSLSILLTIILIPGSLRAQLDPQDVQVVSYFPQVADGGSAAQKWLTSFTFLNPHFTIKATATLRILGNDGNPLALDFGAGPTSQTTFTLAPQGSVTFVSTGASTSIATGWAFVTSTLPLEGVVQYRYSVNGVAQQGVSVEATPASIGFLSPVTAVSGVALANPYAGSIGIVVSVLDTNGQQVASSTVNLSPSTHQAFNLAQVFPSLGAAFRGSVQLSGSTAGTYFVALILSGDGGVLSSLPPSGLPWPAAQFERTWKVWLKVLNAAFQDSTASPLLTKTPGLVVDPNMQGINSFACVVTFSVCPAPDDSVHVFYSMAELMSDSDGELAFIAAHELGHVIQSHSAILPLTQFDLKFVPTDREWDADIWGLLLSLEAGYDPWSGTGALGRLLTASTGPNLGLLAPAFDGLNDPHGSLLQRLDNIWNFLEFVCAQVPQACAQYKSVFHPHFPTSAPLDRKGQ